jgi:hypothetical protein
MANYALVFKIQGETYLSKYSDEGILIRQGDCIVDDDKVYDNLDSDKIAFVELIEEENNEITIKDMCIAVVTGEKGGGVKELIEEGGLPDVAAQLFEDIVLNGGKEGEFTVE